MSQTTVASAAAVRIALHHPFWTEVFYSCTVKEATPEEVAGGIETQATDGRTIWINKDFFASIPLEQQVSEIVHELWHKVLLHTTRRGHRDPKLWNMAADYAINSMMKNDGFNFPTTGDKAWLYEPKYNGWLTEKIYADLMDQQKEQEKNGGKPGKGQPGQPKGQPGMSPGRYDIKDAQGSTEEIERFEEDVKATVERAAAMAKAMGNLPASMKSATIEVYKAPREPWYNHLHRYMQSLAVSEYNWAKYNRRALLTHGVMAPLHYAEALGVVVIYVDTSGSCFAALQQANFAGHVNAILAEAKPRRIYLRYFDAKVYPGEVVEAGAFDIKLKPQGGGGTDFRPIFRDLAELMEEEPVEVAIIPTDLLGSFPQQDPDLCPVVWANTYNEHNKAPFGETIYIGGD